MSNGKQQPAPKPGPTQRVSSMRRHNGMWIAEFAEIPCDVFAQYVKKTHGPDLFGMCAAQVEYELHKMPEEM